MGQRIVREDDYSTVRRGARLSRVHRLTALAVILLSAAIPSQVRAHQTGLSFLDLQVHGAKVEGMLDIPSAELAQVMFVDANRDGRLDASDLAASGPSLAGWLATSVRLVGDGKVCDGRGGTAELREDQLISIHATWTCEGEVSTLELASHLTDTLGESHTTLVRATDGQHTAQAMLTREDSAASLPVGGGGGALATAGQFVLEGVKHIFTGADHVLFLLTLLLLGGTLKRIIGIATAFTAAHSITLSLAVLDVVSGVPSRFVESAIAVSIAYVAVENYLLAPPPTSGREPFVLRWRWLITFAFGLVHGFGFAGALRETGLPQENLPVALAAFNVGVEVGQVTIIAAAWPLLRRAVSTAWYRPRGVQFASLGVFAVAVYWFVQRAF